jgi:hypothetical protein
MRSKLAIFLFIISLLIFAGCSAQAPAENTNESLPVPSQSIDPAKAANDNAEELGMLIKLPYEPVEVAFRESEGNLRILTAVVRFSTAEADTITKKAEAVKPAEDTQVKVEEWFPPELVDRSDVQLEPTIPGKLYPATEFFKEPFTTGTMTRIGETDYFYIVLTAIRPQPSS